MATASETVIKESLRAVVVAALRDYGIEPQRFYVGVGHAHQRLKDHRVRLQEDEHRWVTGTWGERRRGRIVVDCYHAWETNSAVVARRVEKWAATELGLCAGAAPGNPGNTGSWVYVYLIQSHTVENC